MIGKPLGDGGGLGEAVAIDEAGAPAEARAEQLEVGATRHLAAEDDEPDAGQVLPAGHVAAEQVAVHRRRPVQHGEAPVGDAIEQRLPVEAAHVQRADRRARQQRAEDVLHGRVVAVGGQQAEPVVRGRARDCRTRRARSAARCGGSGARPWACPCCRRCRAGRPARPDRRAAAPERAPAGNSSRRSSTSPVPASAAGQSGADRSVTTMRRPASRMIRSSRAGGASGSSGT